MVKHQVAVCIPIYKEKLDKSEKFSLDRCLTVLSNHPIIFFAPTSLNMEFYELYIAGKTEYIVIRFDDHYFSGIPGYNQLMLSAEFYKKFIEFQYILIYQLDAYVFDDELKIWCKKGYDYIGAPYIFVDLDNYPIKVFTKYRKLLKFLNHWKLLNYSFRHVGNGGFSLRHVSHTIRFLQILESAAARWPHNEDSFFTHYGNLFFWLFTLAPEREALKFAFEERPEEAFHLNGQELPFGCHAFVKHNQNGFWSTHFKSNIHAPEL